MDLTIVAFYTRCGGDRSKSHCHTLSQYRCAGRNRVFVKNSVSVAQFLNMGENAFIIPERQDSSKHQSSQFQLQRHPHRLASDWDVRRLRVYLLR